jgi:hypothetical protein
VQMDGGFHAWLEERGPGGCLMNMVDDATGATLCRLGEQEMIWAAVAVLRGWIERHGVRPALYTDWKKVYQRQATSREQLHGIEPETQFGRMCERLGIRIIAAHSPQAKGRVLTCGQPVERKQRDASGPAGEEAEAEGECHTRGSQRVHRSGVPGRA